MKKLYLFMAVMAMSVGAWAQSVTATWTMGDVEHLSASTIEGDQDAAALLSTSFELGANIGNCEAQAQSNAETGYEGVVHEPPFAAFSPKTKTNTKNDGHYIAFTVTPRANHKFKPVSLSFDAMKVGTDYGNFDIYYRIGRQPEMKVVSGVSPSRNRVGASNPKGYGEYSYSFGDVITDGEAITFYVYIYNINGIDTETPKRIGLRNVKIDGVVDQDIFKVSDFVTSFTCNLSTERGVYHEFDILPYVKDLTHGGDASYDTLVYGTPTDFTLTVNDNCKGGYEITSDKTTVTVTLYADEAKKQPLKFEMRFVVTNRGMKPAAKPLNRGLMAVNLTGAKMGTGNLVSWRHRDADGYGVKYRLYRGDASAQTLVLNRGMYIIDRTNFADATGTADNYYRLEVYDKTGKLIDSEVSRKTWDNQCFYIPVDRPVDTYHDATYDPNDASFCDMDGDGEYEIILKWSPSNEKDAASSGTTSPAIFDCYKLDGTKLWRIDSGDNFFTSAHTMQFIAWDFDGDGYGEFMMKTAPGTIDGEGNYVILGNDNPKANLLSSRGKQDHGSEYITVFDGLTGAELATIPYHTAYGDVSTSIWGDSNQNRSERYLAGLAYLDGYDKNPSPIFARGYYAGAFVGAYDWDGETLKERWVSRNTTSGKGLWGDGAHWLGVGDCDGDGKQEIIYGSSALDHDGSLLYRTGLGHGDALHFSDFIPEREGLEVVMCHEASPYGVDVRDAATGKILYRMTHTGDTGRALAAHFDSTSPHSQFITSCSAGMHDVVTGEMTAPSWAIGSSGAAVNNRIYWDGDLYDEFYDKSVLAHWDPANKWFGRIQVNATNYTIGTMNNGTKKNPCVMGDLLGDWREEIVLWDNDADGNARLIINATSYTSDYRLPHLMDFPDYRCQVVNQNCCYNQPPHLPFDPAIVYAGNPNQAVQKNVDESYLEEVEAVEGGEEVIYNLQGIRLERITGPGLYIVNGRKVVVK